MVDKRLQELVEQFDDLTLKKMMKVLATKAAGHTKLYFKEIMDEFEKTLLQAFLETHDYNKIKLSARVKLHRNTIANKMEKLKIKEKKKK